MKSVTHSRSIFSVFLCCAAVLQVVVASPWVRYEVTKVGSQGRRYLSPRQATEDTFEALMALIGVDSIVNAQRTSSDIDVLLLNKNYFPATTASSAPSSTSGSRRRGGRGNNNAAPRTPVPPPNDLPSSDTISNRLPLFYEDRMGKKEATLLPVFIDRFCRTIYNLPFEKIINERSELFDRIGAFEIIIADGYLTFKIYLEIDARIDGAFDLRWPFNKQTSSFFVNEDSTLYFETIEALEEIVQQLRESPRDQITESASTASANAASSKVVATPVLTPEEIAKQTAIQKKNEQDLIQREAERLAKIAKKNEDRRIKEELNKKKQEENLQKQKEEREAKALAEAAKVEARKEAQRKEAAERKKAEEERLEALRQAELKKKEAKEAKLKAKQDAKAAREAEYKAQQDAKAAKEAELKAEREAREAELKAQQEAEAAKEAKLKAEREAEEARQAELERLRVIEEAKKAKLKAIEEELIRETQNQKRENEEMAVEDRHSALMRQKLKELEELKKIEAKRAEAEEAAREAEARRVQLQKEYEELAAKTLKLKMEAAALEATMDGAKNPSPVPSQVSWSNGSSISSLEEGGASSNQKKPLVNTGSIGAPPGLTLSTNPEEESFFPLGRSNPQQQRVQGHQQLFSSAPFEIFDRITNSNHSISSGNPVTFGGSLSLLAEQQDSPLSGLRITTEFSPDNSNRSDLSTGPFSLGGLFGTPENDSLLLPLEETGSLGGLGLDISLFSDSLQQQQPQSVTSSSIFGSTGSTGLFSGLDSQSSLFGSSGLDGLFGSSSSSFIDPAEFEGIFGRRQPQQTESFSPFSASGFGPGILSSPESRTTLQQQQEEEEKVQIAPTILNNSPEQRRQQQQQQQVMQPQSHYAYHQQHQQQQQYNHPGQFHPQQYPQPVPYHPQNHYTYHHQQQHQQQQQYYQYQQPQGHRYPHPHPHPHYQQYQQYNGGYQPPRQGNPYHPYGY